MPIRLLSALAAGALAAAALVVAPSAPALAAGTSGSAGWVRVAHLSPDTTAVDVRLASLDGGSTVIRADDVSYGAVSRYWALPAGEYAVAMRPAGSSPSSTPVVQTSIDVRSGSAATVAVFGRNADLKTKVIEDSLTLPSGGDARVRVVQASTSPLPVTVTAEPSTTVLEEGRSTTVSPYADVRAGTWRLTASRGSDRAATTSIDLSAGQVASVLVLDDAKGGLVLKRVLDSASVGGVPKGYLATGGGYLAHEEQQQDGALLLSGTAAAVVLALGAGLVVRRRRARA